LTVISTPGHTPACVSYLIGDSVFIGDTLFMPDYGCARCDFPGGSAEELYESVITRLYSLPDETRLFVCHDYLPESRSTYSWETTIGEQKKNNIWLNQNTKKEEFIKRRKLRDDQLAPPKLIAPSLQFNLRSGKLPTPESNGLSYLKFPINHFIQN